MRRFFAQEFDGKNVKIGDSEATHIAKVLRMQPGEKIVVPWEGRELVCVLERVNREVCIARVEQERPCPAEPKMRITLYQAYMKANKMEWIAQKATELGVSAYVPFLSSRCVRQPAGAAQDKAVERLERISLEAVKQCGRASLVKISRPLAFAEMLEALKGHQKVVFAYEEAKEPLKPMLQAPAEDVALVVGPEGGCAPEEAQAIVEAGGQIASLGQRILRGETAAVALTAIVAYEMGC